MIMSATRSALETYELLEQILSFLPALELLTVARCVSKDWRNIVDTSLILKWGTWRYPGSENPFSKKPNRSKDELFQLYPNFELGQIDTLDLFLMQEHLDRNYQINPVAPLILRKLWKTLFAVVEANLDTNGVLEEEVINSVAEKFIRSFEPLGLYLTRPTLESTSIYVYFSATFRMSDPLCHDSPSIPSHLKNEAIVKVIETDCRLSDIIRILYNEAISSQGWNLVKRTEERLKMLKEGSLVEDVPKHDPVGSRLLINIRDPRGMELGDKYHWDFAYWMIEGIFEPRKPWIVDILERGTSIRRVREGSLQNDLNWFRE
ncbi:hypothetical protein TWF970_007865 [Orbilia oligospora]|uniref:F-box domain-containing protein n=1 Tax=Orbilia oligospora TaxID=2813651 RepID=A0A7C8R6T4_ORBOL|nr:hypothetical protein TWF970_007865 [Orbilia oligospora]